MEFSKHFQRVRNVGEAIKVAFAVRPTDEALTLEDLALLKKVAAAVVDRRMASPAVLFLESVGPMNFLGSQALHFLGPILSLACDARELERAAHLLERRDAIPRLIALIEAESEAKQTTP
jgi:hypothetical protein